MFFARSLPQLRLRYNNGLIEATLRKGLIYAELSIINVPLLNL